MIALYIIGGIILLLILILIIPISADIRYKDELFVKVKYGSIGVFDSSKHNPENEKEKPSVKKENKKAKEKKENTITKIFNEKGKIEGIKFLARLIKSAISRIIWVIKKISFRKFFVKIVVSSDDAANTAIAYGAVCAAVYPIINILEQNTNLSVKEVGIYTDFEKISPEIETAVTLKTRLIYAVIAGISLLLEYLRIKKESDKNGRKQSE